MDPAISPVGRATNMVAAVVLVAAAALVGVSMTGYLVWAGVYWLQHSSAGYAAACFSLAFIPPIGAGFAWQWALRRADPPVVRASFVGAVSLGVTVTLAMFLVAISAGTP